MIGTIAKSYLQVKLGLVTALVTMACWIVFFLYALDPSTSGVFPVCPVQALTGLHCPGCGALRAAHALLHGDILRALGFNCLVGVGVLAGAWTLLLRLAPSCQVRQWALQCLDGLVTPRMLIWLVLLFVLLRNLPFEPFVLLSPE